MATRVSHQRTTNFLKSHLEMLRTPSASSDPVQDIAEKIQQIDIAGGTPSQIADAVKPSTCQSTPKKTAAGKVEESSDKLLQCIGSRCKLVGSNMTDAEIEAYKFRRWRTNPLLRRKTRENIEGRMDALHLLKWKGSTEFLQTLRKHEVVRQIQQKYIIEIGNLRMDREAWTLEHHKRKPEVRDRDILFAYLMEKERYISDYRERLFGLSQEVDGLLKTVEEEVAKAGGYTKWVEALTVLPSPEGASEDLVKFTTDVSKIHTVAEYTTSDCAKFEWEGNMAARQPQLDRPIMGAAWVE